MYKIITQKLLKKRLIKRVVVQAGSIDMFEPLYVKIFHYCLFDRTTPINIIISVISQHENKLSDIK